VAFAPWSVAICFLQPNALVTIVKHAKVRTTKSRKLEADRLDGFAFGIQHSKHMRFVGTEVRNFQTLPPRPIDCGLLIDFDFESMRIYLAIGKRRRFFKERIIDSGRKCRRCQFSLVRPRKAEEEGLDKPKRAGIS
jgi:hypothetical protein